MIYPRKCGASCAIIVLIFSMFITPWESRGNVPDDVCETCVCSSFLRNTSPRVKYYLIRVWLIFFFMEAGKWARMCVCFFLKTLRLHRRFIVVTHEFFSTLYQSFLNQKSSPRSTNFLFRLSKESNIMYHFYFTFIIPFWPLQCNNTVLYIDVHEGLLLMAFLLVFGYQVL